MNTLPARLPRPLRNATAGLLLSLASLAALAGDGWIGFSIDVSVESMFSLNPTLSAVRIKAVQPGSPAAASGLRAEDQVVKVGDVTVAGAKADTLKAAMNLRPGQAIDLTIQRGEAAPQVLHLVAGTRPS